MLLWGFKKAPAVNVKLAVKGPIGGADLTQFQFIQVRRGGPTTPPCEQADRPPCGVAIRHPPPHLPAPQGGCMPTACSAVLDARLTLGRKD